MGNRPSLNTLYMICFISVNIIFNFTLIPVFGVNGAALATSLAYLFAAILNSLMVKRYLKIKI